MKHILYTTLICAGLLFAPGTGLTQETAAGAGEQTTEVAEEGPLTATLEAQLVELVTNDEGVLVEQFSNAVTAVPGDVIQYTGTYTNISETPLVGLIVNGPVPAGTGYIDGSATSTVDAVLEVLIEGEEWQELPAYKTITDENGQEQRIEALPSDYLQLRWRILEPLEPETEIQTLYRVAVDS